MRRNPAPRIETSWRSGWALAAALLASLAGCSGDRPNVTETLYPVTGKVTLPDGKPLEKTRVVFDGPVSSNAVTGTDGSFDLGADTGLPVGKYKVRLEVAEGKGSPRRPILPFPGKYLDEGTSDLNAEVKAEGSNDFDLKLTKGDGKAGESPRAGKSPR